jgi:DNA modification methylase
LTAITTGSPWEIKNQDVMDGLNSIRSESIDCVVTSPPYWALRDYKVAGQIGLEPTLDEYIAKLVRVFDLIRRALKPSGTVWLNMGDLHYSGDKASNGASRVKPWHKQATNPGSSGFQGPNRLPQDGLKTKDLIGLPWLVAFALRSAGWWLRSDVIWAKPNPMPESVQDRPTRAHEYIFLLTKAERYYYDANAIRDQYVYRDDARPFGKRGNGDRKDTGRIYVPIAGQHLPNGWNTGPGAHGRERHDKQRGHGRRHDGFIDRWDRMTKAEQQALGANKRTVWTMATQPFPDAHFATFPEELPTICIKAGCPEGGVVMDPFAGSGTTGVVARKLGRQFVGIELNTEYCEMAEPPEPEGRLRPPEPQVPAMREAHRERPPDVLRPGMRSRLAHHDGSGICSRVSTRARSWRLREMWSQY